MKGEVSRDRHKVPGHGTGPFTPDTGQSGTGDTFLQSRRLMVGDTAELLFVSAVESVKKLCGYGGTQGTLHLPVRW